MSVFYGVRLSEELDRRIKAHPLYGAEGKTAVISAVLLIGFDALNAEPAKITKTTKPPHQAKSITSRLPEKIRPLVKPANTLEQPNGCPVHGKGCGFAKGGGLWWCATAGAAVRMC